MSFAKLSSSLVTSTLWVQDHTTIRVFIALLATADSEGSVSGTVPGYASLCRMSIEEFEASMAVLTSPDKYSRTPDNEGRRVKAVPGGWLVLNYALYRDSRDNETRRQQNAAAQRKHRAKLKVNGHCHADVSSNADSKQAKADVSQSKPESAPADAESQMQTADTENRNGDGPKGSAPASKPDFMDALRSNPAYKGIDVDREHGKAEAWCLAHSKQLTKRRFVNWLNRADAPLNGHEQEDEPEQRRRPPVRIYTREEVAKMEADDKAAQAALRLDPILDAQPSR